MSRINSGLWFDQNYPLIWWKTYLVRKLLLLLIFSSMNRAATFSDTFEILGVNKGGFYSANKETYILPYTVWTSLLSFDEVGTSICFQYSRKSSPNSPGAWRKYESSQPDWITILEPPNFDNVVLSCMYMFVPDEEKEDHIAPMTPSDSLVVSGLGQFSLQTDLTFSGIEFPQSDPKWKQHVLRFGCTVQDVQAMLGPPQYISYKTNEHISFHSL